MINIIFTTCSANYNPVRSVAANIHSLHSCYSGEFSRPAPQQLPGRMVIEWAALAYMQVDRGAQKIARSNDRDGFLPERSSLFTLLQWATSSDTPVHWPSDMIGLADPNLAGGSHRGMQRSRRLSSALTSSSALLRPLSAASSASTVRSASVATGVSSARSGFSRSDLGAASTTASRAAPKENYTGTNLYRLFLQFRMREGK